MLIDDYAILTTQIEIQLRSVQRRPKVARTSLSKRAPRKLKERQTVIPRTNIPDSRISASEGVLMGVQWSAGFLGVANL